MRYLPFLLVVLVACAPAEKLPVNETGKEFEALAVLAVHSGEVFVNDAPAGAGMDLHAGDVVRTMAQSKASVVFFDSSILRLDENTEITVKKISPGAVDLKQSAGQTWSRILKLSGIQEYTIETPNTVATVRGTGFGVKVSDGYTKIVVKKGRVHVASFDDGKMLAEAMVVEDMELVVTEEAPAEMDLGVMEHDEWVDENVAADAEFIEEVVEEFVEEHPEEEQAMEDFVAEETLVEEVPEEPVEEAPVEEVVTDEIPIEDVQKELPEEPVPEEQPVEEPLHDAADNTLQV